MNVPERFAPPQASSKSAKTSGKRSSNKTILQRLCASREGIRGHSGEIGRTLHFLHRYRYDRLVARGAVVGYPEARVRITI